MTSPSLTSGRDFEHAATLANAATKNKAIRIILRASNARVERRATEYWMLALYPSRVRSNALLDDGWDWHIGNESINASLASQNAEGSRVFARD